MKIDRPKQTALASVLIVALILLSFRVFVFPLLQERDSRRSRLQKLVQQIAFYAKVRNWLRVLDERLPRWDAEWKAMESSFPPEKAGRLRIMIERAWRDIDGDLGDFELTRNEVEHAKDSIVYETIEDLSRELTEDRRRYEEIDPRAVFDSWKVDREIRVWRVSEQLRFRSSFAGFLRFLDRTRSQELVMQVTAFSIRGSCETDPAGSEVEGTLTVSTLILVDPDSIP